MKIQKTAGHHKLWDTRFGKKPIYETSGCNCPVVVSAYSASYKNGISLISPIYLEKVSKSKGLSDKSL